MTSAKTLASDDCKRWFSGMDTEASKSRLERRKAITRLVWITHDRQPNVSDTGLLPNTSLKTDQSQEMAEKGEARIRPKCVHNTKQIIFHVDDLIHFVFYFYAGPESIELLIPQDLACFPAGA